MEKKNLGLTYILLVIVAMLWASAFVAAREVVREVPPVVAATLRFLLSGLIIMPLALYREKNRRYGLKNYLYLVIMGFTGIFLYNLFFFFGVKFNPASDSSLVIAVNPIVVSLLAALFLKEKLTFEKILGLIISFIGVLLVISEGHPLTYFQGPLEPTRFLLFGAVISWAIYSVISKKVMGTVSPLATTAFSIFFGAIFFLPWGIGEMQHVNMLKISLKSYLLIIHLAVFPTVLAFFWWNLGIKKVGAQKSALFINLIPIFTLILSAVFLGEKITLPRVLGGLLVILGVLEGSYGFISLPANKETSLSS
ncbi:MULTISPECIES: DMT family transporter [Carboxydothermus]|uniref:Drug/metabolite transporter (DMT)-like permease n=2 Tax=Carboxydothermus TaxID=129957 RepID=A0ABX2RAR2_9THEO|nr:MULTISPECIES: DMT family transporter [Carboxydothermus]ABB15377.1 putative membrane protein [Carboxydothermus hydrogenoformans Z-2901]NYE58014.1 drug/metabolite transporter (DMT)-like permease [Carboxydothermus ferrireducens DSM 11255]